MVGWLEEDEEASTSPKDAGRENSPGVLVQGWVFLTAEKVVL